MECTPDGRAAHWDKLLKNVRLEAALNEVLGEGAWELERNLPNEETGNIDVRMWYAPITFPEAGPDSVVEAGTVPARHTTKSGSMCMPKLA